MKFYIASRVWKRKQVQELEQKLMMKGHSMTFDWTKKLIDMKDPANIQKSNQDEIRGIQTCDIFVLLGDEDKGAGLHVELGIALAHNEIAGKPVIYVVNSKKEHCNYYFHPAVHFLESIEDLMVEFQKEGIHA